MAILTEFFKLIKYSSERLKKNNDSYYQNISKVFKKDEI